MAANGDPDSGLFRRSAAAKDSTQVECLGMTFESDEARREYFLRRLKEKLPELRQRPDFPVAEDEDILRLSDPPYYTACPNPFLTEFIEHHGRPYDADEPYHREPFAVDVSAGKTDPLYRAHGYHTKVPHLAIPFDVGAFQAAAIRLLAEVEAEVGWMYETRHTDGQSTGRINYTLWSEVFSCPDCTGEVVFLDEALDKTSGRTRAAFPCPHCAVKLTKDNLVRSFQTLPDPASGKPWKRIRLRPVLIDYTVDDARYQKDPDAADLQLLDRVTALPLPPEVPTNAFPIDEMYHGSRLAPKGFTHVHHLFLPRAAHALAGLWRRADACEDSRLRSVLLFFVEQAISGMSVLNRYQPLQHGRLGGSQVNRQLSGVYYVGSQIAEVCPWYILDSKLHRLVRAFQPPPSCTAVAVISTGDCAASGLADESIDYVFTDPPFGENIFYADLNYLVESWHRACTRSETEAIVDRPKGKAIADYQRLMQRCFEAYRRVLKPGRWITVVFHNSRNAIWNAIQEAMLAAGFVVADVRTLDKQQGSYRQVTSTAVKQDLVISAYKPNGGLEDRFRLQAGTEDGAWDFVRSHLQRLPVFVGTDGRAEVIAERQSYLLFDRMVAFHVQRGVTVPLSATEFHAGLRQRFPERDGMFFLREQVVEYDPRRLAAREIVQLELFVRDEETAIRWLRQQLERKPQTFQDIHPLFIRELAGWLKHERMIDLSEFLAQNFLPYDGRGEVPRPIHRYLSRNFKELRNLPKDDYRLRVKAKDRWYVPDPHKATDLAELRTRGLLREFDEYRASTQRRLKLFRLEAVRAGFRRAWQAKDYATIVDVARKIPDDVLHEDPKLLMWYDQASTRAVASRG